MITVGTASAKPGEISTGRLEVGEGRDGGTVGLPVAVVNGARDGDRLYLQAASDGDEVNGVGVVTQVVPRLDPASLAGSVIVVGIVNYHGFLVGEHRNPIDDTKLNRSYPGSHDGTSSERIAAATYALASESDIILDLHQGSTSRMIEEVRVRCGRRHRTTSVSNLRRRSAVATSSTRRARTVSLPASRPTTVSRQSTPNSAGVSASTRTPSATVSRVSSTSCGPTAFSMGASRWTSRPAPPALTSTARLRAASSTSTSTSATGLRATTRSLP